MAPLIRRRRDDRKPEGEPGFTSAQTGETTPEEPNAGLSATPEDENAPDLGAADPTPAGPDITDALASSEDARAVGELGERTAQLRAEIAALTGEPAALAAELAILRGQLEQAKAKLAFLELGSGPTPEPDPGEPVDTTEP